MIDGKLINLGHDNQVEVWEEKKDTELWFISF